MKYRYLYQTKTNENREGEIAAKNRAEAYAALRKKGIRPYRLIGDDPVRWQPWAAGAAFAALAAALFAALVSSGGGSASPECPRGQLRGDDREISAGVADGWTELFPSPLDRFLAAYAQPGWIALPPDSMEAALAAFEKEANGAARPVAAPGGAVARQIAGIVDSMREEMRRYLDSGGTARGYLEFLESRQDDEIAFREEAEKAVREAPESLKETARINMNMRLRAQGMSEIE